MVSYLQSRYQVVKIYLRPTGPLEINPLMNPCKAMLTIFGSRAMVSKVEDFRLTLIGKEITPAAFAKDLGVILDPCLQCPVAWRA